MNKYRIIRLHFDGYSQRDIANTTGFSRNTVKKYIDDYKTNLSKLENLSEDADPHPVIEAIVKGPKYDSSNRMPRKYSPEIDALLDKILADEEEKTLRLGPHHKQKLTKSQIHQLIVNEGYDIGLTTIRTKINEKRDISNETYIRQDYPYGQRFEYDFGEVRLIVDGRNIKAYLAVMTSPASGFRWAYLYYDSKMDVFIDSQVRFFEMLGGCYEEGVYDNMRNVVSRFIGRNEKELNESLVKLAMYYGFHINVTNCFSGNEKGTVESAVKWIRNKVFAKRYIFDSFAEANEFLQNELIKINTDSKIEEEKKYLSPYRPPYESARIETRSVDKYSFIKIDTNFYSVPDHLSEKEVIVKIYPNDFTVCYKGETILTRKREMGKNKTYTDIDHYLNTFLRKPGALRNSLALKSVPVLKDIFDNHYKDNPKAFIAKLIENRGLELEELVEVLKPDHKRIASENNQIEEETFKQISAIAKLFTGGVDNEVIH